MLFPVQSRLQGVRLIGFKATTAATPSITININPDEFVSPTRGASAGLFTLPLRRAGSRTLQLFGCPAGSSTGLNGGSVMSTSIAGETSTISGILSGTNGTATDGEFNGIIASSNSKIGDRSAFGQVFGCKRQQCVIQCGDITIGASTATVNKGVGDFTVVRTGAGAATVTFRRQIFGSTPIVVAQQITSNGFYAVRVFNESTTGFQVQFNDYSGSTINERFNFIVYGFAAKDSYGAASGPLLSTQRGMRLELYRVTASALTIGSQFATTTGSNGNGDWTVNFRDPFRQKPFCFTGAANATAKGVAQNLPTTALAQTYNWNYPNTLANSTGQDILIIGADDPSEY